MPDIRLEKPDDGAVAKSIEIQIPLAVAPDLPKSDNIPDPSLDRNKAEVQIQNPA